MEKMQEVSSPAGNSAPAAAMLETVLIKGDLSKLTPAERMSYYLKVCEYAGLNPYTRPFQYIEFDGKMVLYAAKSATEQLRTTRKISITGVETKLEGDIYTVTAHARDLNSGREDADVGCMCVTNLKGVALSNAFMKAHTKAKRRVTLSICGLAMLDESETDDVVGAKVVDAEVPLAGEFAKTPSAPAKASSPTPTAKGTAFSQAEALTEEINWLLVSIADDNVSRTIAPYVLRAADNIKELNVIKSKLEKKLKEKAHGAM